MPPESDKLTKKRPNGFANGLIMGPRPSDQRIAELQEKYAQGEQVVTLTLSEDWQNRRYEPEKLWAYRPLKVEKYQRESPRGLVCNTQS